MPDYVFNDEGVERLTATAVSLLMRRGDARSVSMLAFGKVTAECTGEDFGRSQWRMHVALPMRLYAQFSDEDFRATCSTLKDTFGELLTPYNDEVWFTISPAIGEPPEQWRNQVAAWLTGEGVTNQGRVRSDNPAPIEVDGLLFRSTPEVHLYRAFKSRGVYFAPLAVFLRGGSSAYQRLEPDFFVVQEGRAMIVEIDGATVHTESPAEADERLRALKREGIFVERRRAAECDTPEKAGKCADDLLRGFEQWRSSR